MRLAVDLHSHSGYAGGVGQIELSSVSGTMKLKGIDVFGTGDCLFPPRTNELDQLLQEREKGLFALPEDSSRFLLQTELIITVSLPGYKNKIVAHHIILFPDFHSIRILQDKMEKWGVKNTIGRPFLVNRNKAELEERLFEISRIDPLIEIIPAHVMTPDGILGSKNSLSSIVEFYGSFLPNIRVIETGLSADPDMLSQIPDLKDLTFISNSDCHSSALNRIGREFTILEADDMSYKAIIEALRNNDIIMTAEFNPEEGRYYLTGHRKNRQKHDCEVVFFNNEPEDGICPICGRRMITGVYQRCKQLRDSGIKPLKRDFMHLIPLVEVIAHSLEVKSVSSEKVKKALSEVMKIYPSEISLWQSDKIEEHLDKRLPPKTINQISAVKSGNFRFHPPGFDGIYGRLQIGDTNGKFTN
jgi:uncharacterized protein (TIGR00375 family)